VLCPHCRQAGQLSTVRVLRTTEPKAPKDHYFDEQGAEHSHNPNIVITEFVCSNGHRFAERSSWECWCGYKACEAGIVEPTVAGDEAPAAIQAGTRRTPGVPEAIEAKRRKAAKKR
jgi:hypothetical protein